MSGRERDRKDRRFFRIVAGCLLGAIALIGIGMWGAASDWALSHRFGSGIVAGVLLIGLAVFELVRRMRHGPQRPGRHTRD